MSALRRICAHRLMPAITRKLRLNGLFFTTEVQKLMEAKNAMSI